MLPNNSNRNHQRLSFRFSPSPTNSPRVDSMLPSRPETPCLSSDSISSMCCDTHSSSCASSQCGCREEAETCEMLGEDPCCAPPLLPGLPDELAVECLLRLPRRSHRSARGVCRRWREFIQTPQFYQQRRQRGVQEGWLYVLSRDSSDRLWWRALDPSSGKWHDVPRLPSESSRAYGLACGVCEGRLYVVGGAGWHKAARADVFCYSPPNSRWQRVKEMAHARLYSMCGTLGGRLVVAGGMGSNSALLTSVEAYCPAADAWSSLAPLPLECDLEDAAVLSHHLLLRRMRCIHSQPGPSAVAYDPRSDSWAQLEGPLAASWHGPSACLGGRLFMLDQIGGLKLLVFDAGSDSWRPVGRLSPALLTPPCRLLGFRGRLFVVGRGSSMVAVDLAATERAQGGGPGAPAAAGGGLGEGTEAGDAASGAAGGPLLRHRAGASSGADGPCAHAVAAAEISAAFGRGAVPPTAAAAIAAAAAGMAGRAGPGAAATEGVGGGAGGSLAGGSGPALRCIGGRELAAASPAPPLPGLLVTRRIEGVGCPSDVVVSCAVLEV